MKKLLFIILMLGSLFSQDMPPKSDIENMNSKDKILLYERLKLDSADYIFFPIFGYSKIGKLKKYFKIIMIGYPISFFSFISTVEILGGGLSEIEDGLKVGMSGGIATQTYLRIQLNKEINKYNENLYKNINNVKP